MTTQLADSIFIAEEKKQCIDNIEGKYLVIAGPGTGKTFTLSQRIKNILTNGKTKNGEPTSPERVLCLSYTNVAAKEMENAVKKAMNDETVNVNSATFHSFCNSIINDYSNEFDIETTRLVTDNICKIFIKEIIEDKTIPLPNLYKDNEKKYKYINTIYETIKKIKNLGYYYTDKDKFQNALNDSKHYGGKLKLYKLKQELLNKPLKSVENGILETEEKIAKLLEAFDFYIELNKKMQKYGYMDFDDMILMIINKFENDKNFLKDLADKFDYILIDEYQDTNPIQNKIIKYLGGEDGCPNIFAVGDDDQSIYSFQGAKASAMKDFIEELHIPKGHIYCLTENRRSLQNILDISRIIADTQNDYSKYHSHRLGQTKNPNRVKLNSAAEYKQSYIPLVADDNFKDVINKKLKQKNDKLTDNSVKFFEYDNTEQEKLSVVNQINKLIDKGVKPSEIAILATSNEELSEYADLLKIKGISYELKDGTNIFKIRAVMTLLAYLQLLVDPNMYADKFYSYLLSEPLNLPFSDYKKIHKSKAKYKCLIKLLSEKEKSTSAIKQFIEENKGEKIANDLIAILSETEFKEQQKINEFLETYNTLKTKKKDAISISALIIDTANKTGILDYYAKNDIDNKTDNILGIRKLVQTAEEYETLYKDEYKDATLYNFIEYITDLAKSNIQITTDKPLFKKSAVQLTTYHSSKGKEYEYVFMPNLINTKWEKNQNNKDIKINLEKYDHYQYDYIKNSDTVDLELEFLEEEKREKTFMERARLMFVGITRAKHSLYLSYAKEKDLSWFVEQIKQNYPREKDIFEYQPVELKEDAETDIYENMLMSKDYNYEEDFKDFVDFKIENLQPFSPSSINSYLTCPRKFYYEYILGLTATLSDETNTIYGKAMHYACEQAVKHIVENGYKEPLSIDEFYDCFKRRLKDSAVSEKVIEEKMIDGKNSIYGNEKKDSFYRFFSAIPTENYFKAECKVRGEIETEEGQTVKVEGVIDRLDYNPKTKEYSIIDYKATDKDIKDKIKIDGENKNYYNQIAIYKWLLTKGNFYLDDKYHKEPFNVTSTQFYLTERNKDADKLVDLKLTDCEDVKNIFVETINNIKSYQFGNFTENQYCDYCHNKLYCHFDKLKYLKLKGENSAKRKDNSNS